MRYHLSHAYDVSALPSSSQSLRFYPPVLLSVCDCETVVCDNKIASTFEMTQSARLVLRLRLIAVMRGVSFFPDKLR
jgi:hypothetical protein